MLPSVTGLMVTPFLAYTDYLVFIHPLSLANYVPSKHSLDSNWQVCPQLSRSLTFLRQCVQFLNSYAPIFQDELFFNIFCLLLFDHRDLYVFDRKMVKDSKSCFYPTKGSDWQPDPI